MVSCSTTGNPVAASFLKNIYFFFLFGGGISVEVGVGVEGVEMRRLNGR